MYRPRCSATTRAGDQVDAEVEPEARMAAANASAQRASQPNEARRDGSSIVTGAAPSGRRGCHAVGGAGGMGTRPVARGDRRERTRPIRGSARPGSGRNDLVLRWCVRRNYGSNGPSSERESRGESDNDGGNHQAPLVVWAFTRGGRRARRTKMGSDLAVKPPSIIAPVGIANGPAGGLQGAMMLGQRASSKASDIA